MKIYTKTGDKGKTSLLGGDRVLKSNLRIEAYGTVDELNAQVGLLRDQDVAENHKAFLKGVQNHLFTIGSILATEPSQKKIKLPSLSEDQVLGIETEIDFMDAELPEMRNFVVPGGHPIVSICHISRTVCRRAERRVIALQEHDQVNPVIVQYLNRLSDYLFVLSRKLGQERGVEEVPWKPEKS